MCVSGAEGRHAAGVPLAEVSVFTESCKTLYILAEVLLVIAAECRLSLLIKL